jgi:hypothetical protein
MTDEITREMFQHSTVVIAGLNDRITALEAENERLRGALISLRDCDWVITPLDRMDAVRDIARAALGEKQ